MARLSQREDGAECLGRCVMRYERLGLFVDTTNFIAIMFAGGSDST